MDVVDLDELAAEQSAAPVGAARLRLFQQPLDLAAQVRGAPVVAPREAVERGLARIDRFVPAFRVQQQLRRDLLGLHQAGVVWRSFGCGQTR